MNGSLPVKTIFGVAASIVIFLFVALSGWYVIDAGEKGVELRAGTITRTVDAGLYFKVPFVDSINKISIRTSTAKFERLSTYSKDQQPALLDVSVTYKIRPTDVERVYQEYRNIDGLVENTINRQLPSQVENVFGRYSAIEAVQKREAFVAEIKKALIHELEGTPIIIESIQVERVDYSEAYEQSVEARMKAEVEVQTQMQNLEKERISAQIAVTQAQAKADSQLAQAKSQAEAVRLQGEAEAAAIIAKTKALQSNTNLIELIKAERWDGKLPATMLPNSAVPFINAK